MLVPSKSHKLMRVVRFHTLLPLYFCIIRIAAIVFPCQGRFRRFESGMMHQLKGFNSVDIRTIAEENSNLL